MKGEIANLLELQLFQLNLFLFMTAKKIKSLFFYLFEKKSEKV